MTPEELERRPVLGHVPEDLDFADLGIDDRGEPVVSGDLLACVQRPQEWTGVDDVDALAREPLTDESGLYLTALGERRVDEVTGPRVDGVDLLFAVTNKEKFGAMKIIVL